MENQDLTDAVEPVLVTWEASPMIDILKETVLKASAAAVATVVVGGITAHYMNKITAKIHARNERLRQEIEDLQRETSK